MAEFHAEGQSEWDQRQAFMQRLHNSIVICSESLNIKDFNGWIRALISLKHDLSAFISNDDMALIDRDISNAFSLIRANMGEMDKIRILGKIQQKLHKVMRTRKFDVPIKETSPGSIIKNDRSY